MFLLIHELFSVNPLLGVAFTVMLLALPLAANEKMAAQIMPYVAGAVFLLITIAMILYFCNALEPILSGGY